jgi:formylglycine-generating enzyme required for sulfatase activity
VKTKLAHIFAGLLSLTHAHANNGESDWVELPGACFQMGAASSYPEERPVTKACVSAFEIRRTEVTNAEFSTFVEQTGYVTRAERGWRSDEDGGPGIDVPPGSAVFWPPETTAPVNLNWWRFIEGATWRTPRGPDSRAPALNAPVVHITREDAERFAAWAGGRLPTEAEWEYAARGGSDGALLAWDDAETAALIQKTNTWQGIFPVVNTADDGFKGVAPAASFPANGFGLHDMIGNVWEWTATSYAPSHAERDIIVAGANGLDPSQPGVPVGTIKGGSYLCASSYCYRFRPAARQAQDLAFGTSHIGFRIVRDVGPD